MDEPVEGRLVQRDLRVAFEYAHFEDAWVFPLADALAGVTAEEAVWKPAPDDSDGRCIWQIVLHMTVWTENIVQRMAQRLQGEPPGRPPEGDWPMLLATPDDDAWADAQRRLWGALAALGTYIEETPTAAQLDCGTVGYSQFADLLCRLIHNAYHLGQIIILRQCRAAQLSLRLPQKG